MTSTEVSLYKVPNDLPYGDSDGTAAQFKTYLTFPATLDQKYDLILDDGRARVEVR